MRFSLKGLRPTAYAPEIRECFYGFRNANVVFIGALLVFGFLSQFRFSRDVTVFVAFLVIPILYIRCCAAYGRLARCFGQSPWDFRRVTVCGRRSPVAWHQVQFPLYSRSSGSNTISSR